MINKLVFRRVTFCLAVLLLVSPSLSAAPVASDGACPAVFDDGKPLKVLTLNILFSEYQQREQRLRDIADFIAQRNIHIVALQEVVGGLLDQVLAEELGGSPVGGNTAKEIQRILAQHYGQKYNLKTAFSSGLFGLLDVSNAVLSRCKITEKLTSRLPKATEVELGGIRIEMGRTLLMTRVEIPGWGELDVYNVHLCASSCDEPDRFAQVDAALNFIADVETHSPARHVLFVGDFNTNVPVLLPIGDPGLPRVYRRVTKRHGFTDTYAEYAASVLGTTDLCIPDGFDQGCTVGVSDIEDPFNPMADKKRIDYIFSRGELTTNQSSRVVFNPGAAGGIGVDVSDHSGVITRLKP